jgi:hypothetical protein
VIEQLVPSFSHGSRREDQTPVIDMSGLFGPVTTFDRVVRHRLSRDDYIGAWSSLMRHAGLRFTEVVDAIAEWLHKAGLETLDVPYQTRVWMARCT